MAFSERLTVLDEILSMYLSNVPEKMLKGYQRVLKDVPITVLRRAGARYARNSQSGRKPTPFDLRRLAMEIQGEDTKKRPESPSITALPEHAATVERLRGWNYCEHEISEVLYGRCPVPTRPKRFSDSAWKDMERWSRIFHTSLSELGIVRHPDA